MKSDTQKHLDSEQRDQRMKSNEIRQFTNTPVSSKLYCLKCLLSLSSSEAHTSRDHFFFLFSFASGLLSIMA